ncbi:MAG: DUF4344 domain-containing metallopeptidase [Polyangiales bacterium]
MKGWREGIARAACALALVACASCGGGDDDNDRGDIEVDWDDAPDPISDELSSVMRREKLFEKIAEVLNGSLAFPRDLLVKHEACDEVNAFYDPRTHSLSMCYEMLTFIADRAIQAMGEGDETGERIVGTWLFVFFHELGHGLADFYDLPITGREEDSVDSFSTLLLIEADMAFAALRAAEFWASLPMGELDGAAFADEHSLNAQRFYNILCLVYGSDPDTYEGLVTEGYLPESRAVRCPAEYEGQRSAWDTLLEPWSK